MPPQRAGVASVDNSPHLSPGVWLAAAVEIAVAVAVATLMLRTGETTQASGHGSPVMADMQPSPSAQSGWNLPTLITTVITVAVLVWWLVTRARMPAVLAAAGLVVLGTSETVRGMALQSHLVAMATLEALLVGAPLLLITTLRRTRPTSDSGHSLSWTAWVMIAVVFNSGLLIALHLPAVHGRAARLSAVPLWLTLVVAVVGLSYWGAILITAGQVRLALRRGALIIGQEVAAILGLAALLRPFPHMHHADPFGLSPTLDQRLGGILMLMTCAAVTFPVAKHLEQQQL